MRREIVEQRPGNCGFSDAPLSAPTNINAGLAMAHPSLTLYRSNPDF
jgi:hypothetical protein